LSILVLLTHSHSPLDGGQSGVRNDLHLAFELLEGGSQDLYILATSRTEDVLVIEPLVIKDIHPSGF